MPNTTTVNLRRHPSGVADIEPCPRCGALLCLSCVPDAISFCVGEAGGRHCLECDDICMWCSSARAAERVARARRDR